MMMAGDAGVDGGGGGDAGVDGGGLPVMMGGCWCEWGGECR